MDLVTLVPAQRKAWTVLSDAAKTEACRKNQQQHTTAHLAREKYIYNMRYTVLFLLEKQGVFQKQRVQQLTVVIT